VSDLPAYPSGAAEREAAEAPSGADIVYAGWWSRVGAYFIDMLLVSIIVLLAFVLSALVAAVQEDVGLILLFVVVALAIAGPVWYYIYFTGKAPGQTIGKKALGIRVRHADEDRPIGYGPATARYLITFAFGIFVIPALIDYLWPLWDSRNQSLHDKAANSVVVRA
jgi:uncharacterized RDD family membrane protein YckC